MSSARHRGNLGNISRYIPVSFLGTTKCPGPEEGAGTGIIFGSDFSDIYVRTSWPGKQFIVLREN